ncbi:TIGR03809 family protein [Bradyrhizobium sp. Ash2021]|uniref:TIGR03809 family protein n=1 Tax=Bradyrhizobium sp. Ash2021 TaxID=2954771 RepID=UPI0028152355|nr:TIGR03809 family protein [Bradyrhizobium sp. Ash2021]WMT77890.1 TIGR03809 family protein [Bradyrhizobium sp. Ash2021]
MTLHVDVARGRNVVARWCNLAEQRLEYLTELFETGRWRRFHSELAFLENIQEAKAAVETWRNLLNREAALDNSAVDVSRLSGARLPLPPGDRLRERAQLRQPQPAPATIAPSLAIPERAIPQDVLLALENELIASDEAPSAPDAPVVDEPSLAALDLDAMQDRYPLLRNAL